MKNEIYNSIIVSQTNIEMQKMKMISKQLTNLQQIQTSLYTSIDRRQAQLLQQLKQQQQKFNNQANRQKRIKEQNINQHIGHPYNQHVWMRLANCIYDNQANSLDDVRQRQMERAQERKKIEEEKRYQVSQDQIQNDYYNSNGFQRSNNRGIKNGKQPQQIPWKLMRKLRQHDVEQNIKIIQKQQNDKLTRLNKKHR